MKKKILTLLLACVLATGTIVGPVGMETVQAAESGNWEYDELADGTIEIDKYNGKETAVEIPGKINGKKVTRIGEKAFWGSSITSIKIPSGVTSIGANAFLWCSSLTEIKIPLHVNCDVPLDGTWKDASGNTYTSLPKNAGTSFKITSN